MAKKITPKAAPAAAPAPAKIAPAPIAADPAGIKTTVSRNSPLPKAAPAKKEISHEMIAKRAYEIYVSGKGGSQDENWARAERELRSL
jgi:hypothetical protein